MATTDPLRGIGIGIARYRRANEAFVFVILRSRPVLDDLSFDQRRYGSARCV